MFAPPPAPAAQRTASYYPLKRFKRIPWTVSEKGAGTVSGRVNSGLSRARARTMRGCVRGNPNAALSLFCDATGAVEEAQADKFCELLHTRGFAIVRLPACAHAEAAAVREAAGAFFAMEQDEKRAVGDFRVIGDTYVGYRDTAATRQDCDAEFLEVNLDRESSVP